MRNSIFTAFLFIFIGLATLSQAQNNMKTAFINGWEFLEWGMSTEQVEKLLQKNGVAYTPLNRTAKFPHTKAENYKGFERLVFAYDQGLVQVQLYYESPNKSEAVRFVEQTQKEWLARYGEPTEVQQDDTERSWHWEVGHTTISLSLSLAPSSDFEHTVYAAYQQAE